MTTNFQLAYFLVVVCFPNVHITCCNYVDDFLDINIFIYLDPHDHVRHLEHHSLLHIELRYL